MSYLKSTLRCFCRDLQLSHITFTFAESHLSDGVQQLAIGVQDDAERQDQAEGEQADDVGDIVWRLGLPVH